MGKATGRKLNDQGGACSHTNPTRKKAGRRCHALASASVRRLRVGLMWRGSVVPISMRSLGTDRSLGKSPPAGRLIIFPAAEIRVEANVVVIRLDHESRVQLRPDSRREGNGQQHDVASLHPHGFL